MPEQTPDRDDDFQRSTDTVHLLSPRALWSALLLAFVIVVITMTTLVVTFGSENSLRAVQNLSSHGDCKSKVADDAEQQFRQDIGKIILAAFNHDDATALTAAQHLQSAPNVFDTIKAQCGTS